MIVLRLLILFILVHLSSCSSACNKLTLLGEIETKTRANGVVKSHKKLMAVPRILTPNSSEFGKLKIIGGNISKMTLTYQSETDQKMQLKRSYEVVDGAVQNLNLYQFEQEIEMSRPGLLTLEFFDGSRSCSKIRIEMRRGD